MLTVIAEIRTRPGQHHRQAVLDQFAKIIPTVLKEEGCHGYAPMVDHAAGVSFQTLAPDSIVMIEQWESVAHLEAHLQTPHMKAYSDAVKDDVLEMNIRILESGVKLLPSSDVALMRCASVAIRLRRHVGFAYPPAACRPDKACNNRYTSRSARSPFSCSQLRRSSERFFASSISIIALVR